MGELHLDILVDRMLREFNVQANVGSPRVAYKETITTSVKAEGKFIRQSGGRGQYGHVVIMLEPNRNGTPFKFENKSTGGVIPKEFISSIERGIREAMNSGVLAGYPMTGIKAILIDGSYHDTDSTDIAFKIAGSIALQNGARKAEPILLEPMMGVEVVLPSEYLGDVMNDMQMRRSEIRGIDSRSDGQVIRAFVPLAEMFGYATRLRNLSQGRGIYTMEFAEYAPAPREVVDKMRFC